MIADATTIDRLLDAVHCRLMSARRLHLDTVTATELLARYVDPALRAKAVKPLHGGMVHDVFMVQTDGQPDRVVAKINKAEHLDHFRSEWQAMHWHKQHTRLPLPEPIALIEYPLGDIGSGLIMQYLPVPNLADAQLSQRGQVVVQKELARHLAELHQHRRNTYGSALEDNGRENWIDIFRPMMQREYEHVRQQLPSRVRWIVDDIVRHLEHLLPEHGKPSLIHGDLWSTNILVDDSNPDRPRIRAFIDTGATYCNPEYELAYLSIFKTVDQPFFEAYQQHHRIHSGFERRCRIYWLNTMLLHVRMFGPQYLRVCCDLAEQIRRTY